MITTHEINWSALPKWARYVVRYPGSEMVMVCENEPTPDGAWQSGRYCLERFLNPKTVQILEKPLPTSDAFALLRDQFGASFTDIEGSPPVPV